MGLFFAWLKDAWKQASIDNIGILAAGVAYYLFVAFVPLLAAAVLSYGLFVDTETVARHIARLAELLPADAAGLIGRQLEGMVGGSTGGKGLGLVLALVLALVGARNGAASAISAIMLASNAENTRGFVRTNLLALAITACALVGAGLVALVLAITARIEDLLPGLAGMGAVLARALSYLVLLVGGSAGAAALYRKAVPGPSPSWRAVMPGAILAGAGWMVATLGFGIYVANFGSYNATYGSLGAVIVLLTWLYMVAYVLLFGAELNAARRSGRRD